MRLHRVGPYVFIAGIILAVLCSCTNSDPPAGAAASDPPDVSTGKTLYAAQGCVACHAIGGKGGTIGPDLSNEANKGHSSPWLVTQIRNPKAYKSDTLMPAYPNLTDPQVNELVAYLLTLSTEKKAATAPATPTTGTQPAEHPAVTSASRIKTGAVMWSENCGRCHNYRPASEFTDAQWAVAMRHMRLRVPLTGEQERLILEFLQAGN